VTPRSGGLRWIVAGGGTGGHVTPALALGERIAARGDSVVFLGGETGLETRLVPEAGFELVRLPSRQLMGQGLGRRLRALPAMLRACLRARRVLRQRHADLVVSIGGYASVPAVVAAVLERVPLALVEPNAIPGRANRAAARFARRIFVQFEAAAEVFAGQRDRVVDSGIPLRRALVEAFAAQVPRRQPSAPFRLLVFGGSQGARQLNDAMIQAAPRLDPDALEIFHQAGESDRERVAAAYSDAGLRGEVVAFESAMPRRYRRADLALCRAGALTVAELAMAGLPALLVPYPHAADDHQAANARALAEAGAACLLDPRLPTEALAAAIVECLARLFAAPTELERMSAAAARLARPDAAERVVAEAVAMLEPQGARRLAAGAEG
jgi:UDP-N-acetylglucosamine--N-acetylmuramyl-(pentapeptide) pyrophosphoryl-undecaprenol N-acetylglucosamine transferase